MKSKEDKVVSKIEAETIPLNQDIIQNTVDAYMSRIDDLTKKVEFLQSKLWRYKQGDKAILFDDLRVVEIIKRLEDNPTYLYKVKYPESIVEFYCTNEDLLPMLYGESYIKLLLSRIDELMDENKKLKKNLGR